MPDYSVASRDCLNHRSLTDFGYGLTRQTQQLRRLVEFVQQQSDCDGHVNINFPVGAGPYP